MCIDVSCSIRFATAMWKGMALTWYLIDLPRDFEEGEMMASMTEGWSSLDKGRLNEMR